MFKIMISYLFPFLKKGKFALRQKQHSQVEMENTRLDGPFQHNGDPFGPPPNPPTSLMSLPKGLWRVQRQQQRRGFLTSHKAKPGVPRGQGQGSV